MSVNENIKYSSVGKSIRCIVDLKLALIWFMVAEY